MPRRTEGTGPGWSARDDALWATAELGLALRQGLLKQRRAVPVPFAMQHSADEAPYAFGPFRLLSFEARGDGSYLHRTPFLLAHGRGALPLLIGLGAAAAASNAGRRRRASALAQPQWMVLDAGTVTVSDHGFYLHTPTSILPWNWHALQMATLVGPGCLQLVGHSANGPINWVLETDWAELIFLFWATLRCPGHEQLRERTWLPEEWVTRACIHSRTPAAYRDAAAFQSLISGLGIVAPPR